MTSTTRVDDIPVYVSYGAGVESSALICRWVNEPSTRPTDLANITLVMSQTGN
jgi:hypothetical protein